MSEMVEKAAHAMVDHWYRLAGALPWDKLTEGERDNWRGQARAAIAAMREPTEAMVAVVPYDMYEPDFAENWRVMIDAALK